MLARLALICKRRTHESRRAEPASAVRDSRPGSGRILQMRVAWFSPLPPVHSGIAAYSVDVLAGLRERHQLDLYVDDPVWHAAGGRLHAGAGPGIAPQAGPFGLPLYRAFDFPVQQDRAPYDLIVYQLGNAACHRFMWPYLLRWPGLVVLHDAALHHARAQALLADQPRRRLSRRVPLQPPGHRPARRRFRRRRPAGVAVLPVADAAPRHGAGPRRRGAQRTATPGPRRGIPGNASHGGLDGGAGPLGERRRAGYRVPGTGHRVPGTRHRARNRRSSGKLTDRRASSTATARERRTPNAER